MFAFKYLMLSLMHFMKCSSYYIIYPISRSFKDVALIWDESMMLMGHDFNLVDGFINILDGFVDGPFGQFIRKIKTILVTKLIKTLGDLWCLLRSPRSGSCWKVFTGLLVLVLVIFYFAGRVFRVGGDL